MKAEIEEAIKTSAKKSGTAQSPEAAMKYAQATLNLAHALAITKEATK